MQYLAFRFFFNLNKATKKKKPKNTKCKLKKEKKNITLKRCSLLVNLAVNFAKDFKRLGKKAAGK